MVASSFIFQNVFLICTSCPWNFKGLRCIYYTNIAYFVDQYDKIFEQIFKNIFQVEISWLEENSEFGGVDML